jgi:hypothetical protein
MAFFHHYLMSFEEFGKQRSFLSNIAKSTLKLQLKNNLRSEEPSKELLEK